MGGDAKNILGALIGNPQMEAGQPDPTPNPLLSLAGAPAGLVRSLLSGPGYNDLPLSEQLANAVVMAGGAAATEGKAVPGIYGAYASAATERDKAKVTAAEKAAGAKKLEDLFTEARTPEWQRKYILERTMDSTGKEGATIKNRPPDFTADQVLGNEAIAEAWKRGLVSLEPSGEVTEDGRPRYRLSENKAKTAEAQAFASEQGASKGKFTPYTLPGETLPAAPDGMAAPAGLSPAEREAAVKAKEAARKGIAETQDKIVMQQSILDQMDALIDYDPKTGVLGDKVFSLPTAGAPGANLYAAKMAAAGRLPYEAAMSRAELAPAAEYLKFINGPAATQVAKMAGEVRPTDVDIQRMVNAAPRLGDPKDIAKRARLRFPQAMAALAIDMHDRYVKEHKTEPPGAFDRATLEKAAKGQISESGEPTPKATPKGSSAANDKVKQQLRDALAAEE